jgi:hypothetical protein
MSSKARGVLMKALLITSLLTISSISFASTVIDVNEDFAKIEGVAAKEMFNSLRIKAVKHEGINFKDGKSFRCYLDNSDKENKYYACDIFLKE